MGHQKDFRHTQAARRKLCVRSFEKCALFLAALAIAIQSHASAGGRSGFSGSPHTNAGATCTVCHAPDGAVVPSVGIYGPQTIDAGTTHTFSVWILGGPAQTVGVGLSSDGNVGALVPANSELHLLNGELTHSVPKPTAGAGTAFLFDYTAPNYDTEVTLHAAGNSSNGALDLVGDGIGSGSLALTIVNGFEPPPDPPQPPLAELSSVLFASGLSSPVAIENAGDDRLFVVERAGSIRIVESDGDVLSTPFLNIETRVNSDASEKGLLGLAFHPDYDSNGYFYVYYTFGVCAGPCAPAPLELSRRSRVSRFTVTGDANVADPNSELILMEFAQPYSNHNGGDLHFGPAGYLHIASGDGGSGGDPLNYGQTTTSLLGKMLRIDVDTPAGSGNGPDCDISGSAASYSIPVGNTFADGAGGVGCDEIFVVGVRNPWRFTFDSATGAMWIADVGQYANEEVNYLPPGNSGGINLGWRCFEGFAPYNSSGCNLAYLPPVHSYSHATSGCSITGGRVYRGAAEPLLHGQYFFTDFCQTSIRVLSGDPGSLAHRVVLPAGQLSSVSTFGEDVAGEMYVAELNTGRIYRLDPAVIPGC